MLVVNGNPFEDLSKLVLRPQSFPTILLHTLHPWRCSLEINVVFSWRAFPCLNAMDQAGISKTYLRKKAIQR